jgi:molecular chaperone IbpA
MRQFDLSPLYRSTIGFDRLFNMIDQAAGLEAVPSYPPYNIERTGENAYRISVAVSGLRRTGSRDRNQGKYPYYLWFAGTRGEANGEAGSALSGNCRLLFERRFQLADHVHVTGASLENGLLHVDLLVNS